MRDEDRDTPRIRRGSRALHLRQRVHDPINAARDPRRDLLELPPVLHRASEAGRYRRSRRPLQASRRQGLAPLVVAATAVRDGELVAQRDAPVGGQAVLEGVMMRGVSTWAVALRK